MFENNNIFIVNLRRIYYEKFYLSIYLSIIIVTLIPRISYSDNGCGGDAVPMRHAHDGKGICNGYAMARAFHRLEGQEGCSALDFVPCNDDAEINSDYFYNPTPTYIQDNVEVRDILQIDNGGRYGHYVYVSYINNGNIYVDHLTNPEGEIETRVLLDDVLENYNYKAVTAYFRMKKQWKIKVKNSFDGGNVKVNGDILPSGTTIQSLLWDDNLTLSEIEDGNMYGGYIWRFQYWIKSSDNTIKNGKTINIKIEDDPKTDVTWTAKYAKEFNIRFQNHFEGLSEKGDMIIGNKTYSDISFETVFYILEGNTIQFEALNHSYDHIDYHFDHWSDGNTSHTRDYKPSGHTDFTAYFTGIPQKVQNVRDVGAMEEPIHLVWDRHPNANCKYRIYRKIKQQGDIPVLIATLNNNVTYYIDYEYSKTRSYTDLLISYDVRAYYTVESTEAETNWYTVYGDYFAKGSGSQADDNEKAGEKPVDFRLTSHPNPFNPMTILEYDLPKSSDVVVNVYDVAGNRIKTLFSGIRTPGFYRTTWNGTNDRNEPVAAGIYFIRLITSNKSLSHKIVYVR